MKYLETELIRLRALEPEDIDILYQWENDTDIWRVSNTIAPFSKYTIKQFIADQNRDIYETKQVRLIIESKADCRPVGAIDMFDIDPYNRRAGVGILIYDRRDGGQGYASAALSSLILYAFQFLGLNQLYCNILSANNKSLNLFRSKGFEVVGLKKEWIKTTSDWQGEYLLQLINPQKE